MNLRFRNTSTPFSIGAQTFGTGVFVHGFESQWLGDLDDLKLLVDNINSGNLEVHFNGVLQTGSDRFLLAEELYRIHQDLSEFSIAKRTFLLAEYDGIEATGTVPMLDINGNVITSATDVTIPATNTIVDWLRSKSGVEFNTGIASTTDNTLFRGVDNNLYYRKGGVDTKLNDQEEGSGIYQVYTWTEYVTALSDAVNHKSIYIRENIFAPSHTLQTVLVYGTCDIIVYGGSQIWSNDPDGISNPLPRELKYQGAVGSPAFTRLNFLGNLITYVGWDTIYVEDVEVSSERLLSSRAIDVQLTDGVESASPLWRYEWQDGNFSNSVGTSYYKREMWTTSVLQAISEKILAPNNTDIFDNGSGVRSGDVQGGDLASIGFVEVNTTHYASKIFLVSEMSNLLGKTFSGGSIGIFSPSTSETWDLNSVSQNDLRFIGRGTTWDQGTNTPAEDQCSLWIAHAQASYSLRINRNGSSNNIYVETLRIEDDMTFDALSDAKIYYEKLVVVPGVTITDTAGVLIQKFWRNSYDPSIDSHVESTGLLHDGEGILSVGTGGSGVATTFSITDGTGQVEVDGVTTSVPWSNKTDIAVTNIATQLITFVSIDVNGNVVQRGTRWTADQKRHEIILGVVVHVNNTTVDTVNQEQSVSTNATAQVGDVLEGLGFVNLSGNKFSPFSTDMRLSCTTGVVMNRGINFYVDGTANPHKLTLPVLNPVPNIQYRMKDGTSGALTGEDFVNPDIWDDPATPLAYPGSTVPTNKFTVQRIFKFTSNNVKIQPGQAIYNSMAEAKASIQTEAFETEPSIEANGFLRGYLCVQEGATDLSDPAQAFFLDPGKFGGGFGTGGLSVSTVQNAYDNSADPEFLTDAIRGAMTGQEGTGDDEGKVYEVKNNAGTVTWSVNGNGRHSIRVGTIADISAPFSIDSDVTDQFNVTAQTQAFTLNAPIGNPIDGQKLIYRITDNGTSHTITWSGHNEVGVTLPTQTRGSVVKTLYVGCVYNAQQTRWDVIAVGEEA